MTYHASLTDPSLIGLMFAITPRLCASVLATFPPIHHYAQDVLTTGPPYFLQAHPSQMPPRTAPFGPQKLTCSTLCTPITPYARHSAMHSVRRHCNCALPDRSQRSIAGKPRPSDPPVLTGGPLRARHSLARLPWPTDIHCQGPLPPFRKLFFLMKLDSPPPPPARGRLPASFFKQDPGV